LLGIFFVPFTLSRRFFSLVKYKTCENTKKKRVFDAATAKHHPQANRHTYTSGTEKNTTREEKTTDNEEN